MDALASLRPWIADALVVLGVVVMTLGVYGMLRMPDIYTRLHAASKAVVLGVVVLAAASAVTEQREIILRAVLIAGLLLLTTPISSHVIGKAAHDLGEPETHPAPERGAPNDRVPRTGDEYATL